MQPAAEVDHPRRARRVLTSLALDARPRLWNRWAPLGVVLLAAVLRLQNLGNPHELMFDETYYVKDAWSLLHLGYEGSWPADPNPAFNSGDVNGYLPQASYPAHPPLGKWPIAVGMALFGGSSSFGWRFSTAVAGILAVVLIMAIAAKLFANPALTVLAGGLFAIDGHAIVLSRVSLLDNFVMLFALLGFGAVLLDRGSAERRLDAWIQRQGSHARRRFGPTLWARPWLLAAGLAFGLATAVKWSGLYFLAAFAVYSVVVDALMRRRAGLRSWWAAALVKQAPANFLLIVPVALAVYLAGFAGWFATSGGYDRNWIAEGGARWTGALAWVPEAVQNLWHWHADIYAFHTGLDAAHPYRTSPWFWLLLVRPTQFYYRGSGAGENGCQYDYCSEIVWSIANPILWWGAAAAAVYLTYRLVRWREWRVGLILMGLVAGYLPWLLYPNRTVFQFYAIAFEPYLILGLVLVIGLLLSRRDDPHIRSWRIAIGIFLALVVLASAFFYPLWVGMQTPFWFWQLHVWAPTWV